MRLGSGDNETRKFGKRAKWGRPHSHPGYVWEGTRFWPYRLGVANAASRRREGRLRPPVVYNAGHQGKNATRAQARYDKENAIAKGEDSEHRIGALTKSAWRIAW